jgi:hypothetical protein
VELIQVVFETLWAEICKLINIWNKEECRVRSVMFELRRDEVTGGCTLVLFAKNNWRRRMR